MLNKPTYGSQSIKTAEEILDRIFDERDYYDRHRILKAMREYADQHNFNHHPLSPEDIERAAKEYSSNAFMQVAFTEGANFAKQPHSNEVDEPIYCNCETPTLGKSITRCGTCDNWFKPLPKK